MDQLVAAQSHSLSGRRQGADILRSSGVITDIGRTPDNAQTSLSHPVWHEFAGAAAAIARAGNTSGNLWRRPFDHG